MPVCVFCVLLFFSSPPSPVTRVQSNGVVKIVFNTMFKNFASFGYSIDEKRRFTESEEVTNPGTMTALMKK